MGECSSSTETGPTDNTATSHSGGNGRLAVLVSVFGVHWQRPRRQVVFYLAVRSVGLADVISYWGMLREPSYHNTGGLRLMGQFSESPYQCRCRMGKSTDPNPFD